MACTKLNFKSVDRNLNSRCSNKWRKTFDLSIVAICLSSLSLSTFAQATPGIGQVEQARGVGFIQTPGQNPRSMSSGTRLLEGDRVTTAADSLAIVKLVDGTKMTVRPNSEMVFSEYKYRAEAADNNFVLDLLRGGLRSVTGLINKNSPNAARVKTATATVGIRGTDFEARICQNNECVAQGQGANRQAPVRAQIAASAKFLVADGNSQIVDGKGQRRNAVFGTPVYPGETVETGRNAQAVLAFRDESKVALGASTQFKVDNFVFDNAKPTEGSFLTTLLRGSMRAVTGLIGKANVKNVRYATSTATIGIRGTDVEACEACDEQRLNQPVAVGSGDDVDAGASESEPGDLIAQSPNPNPLALIVYTHSGGAFLTTSDNVVREIPAGSGIGLGPAGAIVVIVQPLNTTRNPNSIVVPAGFFVQSLVPDGQNGLFVRVNEGHVTLTSGSQTIDLGAQEVGFTDGLITVRPIDNPIFIITNPIVNPSTNLPILQIVTRPNQSNPICPI